WFFKPKDMDVKTGSTPFKLDKSSPTEPTKIELVFYVEDTKYSYLLELDEHQVYLEKLSYYKSVQPTKLFERRLENGQSIIDYNLKLSNIVKEKIAVECLKNMSFFAARNQVNTSIPEIDAAMKWMKSKVQQTIYPTIDLTRYAQRKVLKDDALRKYVLDFLREADFNITNIKTNSIKKLFPEEIKEMALKSNEFTEDDKKFIKETSSYEDFNTDFEHTVENERGIETYTMSIDNGEESQGTLRTLGIEAALYTAMNKGAFLTIDEIENSLHSKLLEKILYEYLRTQSRSQLLVTTHNDGLLDLVDDLIRKDSIWFTEKNKSGVTDLYKLTDFRGINRLSSIREAYRNKRFGATMN
ncbi:MAG: ATP-binding protein, partial [Bacteroidaceae bacterium]|nr:ATP-binding protein [Bacteroidaceae bacterium]